MDGTLSARGAKKAADFVNFCDAFCIPVLTITNVTGFKATKCSERTMAKNAAALTAAFANATVPKVNVVVGKAYGSAYVVMNSKSIGADTVSYTHLAPGRPIVFGTTEEFLRNFGVDSTDNLPEISPVKMAVSYTHLRAAEEL